METTILLKPSKVLDPHIISILKKIQCENSKTDTNIPTSTEKITDRKTVQFSWLNDNTLFKQFKYKLNIVDYPKTDILSDKQKINEEAMYHLPEFLRTHTKYISNDCSNCIHNVDSRNEEKDLSQKKYSNK